MKSLGERLYSHFTARFKKWEPWSRIDNNTKECFEYMAKEFRAYLHANAEEREAKMKVIEAEMLRSWQHTDRLLRVISSLADVTPVIMSQTKRRRDANRKPQARSRRSSAKTDR